MKRRKNNARTKRTSVSEKSRPSASSLIVVDFDGTLFATPGPEQGKAMWLEKTGMEWGHQGWWDEPDSLSAVFDIVPDERMINVISGAREDDAYVVLMTGRLETLEPNIIAMLNEANIEIDEIITKPVRLLDVDTARWKAQELAKLVSALEPTLERVTVYDDSQENLDEMESIAFPDEISASFELVGNNDGP